MLDLFEWVWAVIFVVGVVAELVGLLFEDRRRGIEPLTRILRDRIIRHHRVYGVIIFAFWAWLGLHLFRYGVGS